MSNGITLVCWHCGAEKHGFADELPRFAFELAKMADDAGMLGVIDMRYGRSLVFCDQECADAEKTKAGTFRVRAKGSKKAAQPTKDE